MKSFIWIVSGLVLSLSVRAGDLEIYKQLTESQHEDSRFVGQPSLEAKLLASTHMGNLPTWIRSPTAGEGKPPKTEEYESPLSRAINQAKTKGIVERSVEGYTEVLIECQKEQDVVLTTSFMRADAQRDHCYRF